MIVDDERLRVANTLALWALVAVIRAGRELVVEILEKGAIELCLHTGEELRSQLIELIHEIDARARINQLKSWNHNVITHLSSTPPELAR